MIQKVVAASGSNALYYQSVIGIWLLLLINSHPKEEFFSS